MRTLGKLKLLAKDLKGSSGCKQCRRNEIRALVKKLATLRAVPHVEPCRHRGSALGSYGWHGP
jgi:hypothetical protein